MSNVEIYGTAAEMRYIEGIGAHRKPADYVRTPEEYIAWLQLYQASMPHRAVWGLIDDTRIAVFVSEEIMRVQHGGLVPPTPRGADPLTTEDADHDRTNH